MYRNPELDAKLMLIRIKQEARSTLLARKLGVLTPVLYLLEYDSSCLYMERVLGKLVKELVMELERKGDMDAFLEAIGRVTAQMHDRNLIRGDPTTSTMEVCDCDHESLIIDFGLSYYLSLPEDKGVDFYVMERGSTNAHANVDGVFGTVLNSYKKNSKYWSTVLNKFVEASMRDRNRTMVGLSRFHCVIEHGRMQVVFVLALSIPKKSKLGHKPQR